MSIDSNVGMYLDINLYKKVESDPSVTQVAETLDTQYDAETESLTFNTNKFSTYVITYKDVKVDNSGNVGSKQTQTGDNNDMGLWISMLFASVFTLYGVTIRNRKCQYH